MEATSLPTAPPPLVKTEAPPPPQQVSIPYAEMMIIRAQNDSSSSSLPKRGRGRRPKTITSNPNPNPSSSNTTGGGGGGGVQDRSDEVILPAKRGRGRSIAKPKAIVGGGSRPRGRPRKVITDASSGSGPAGAEMVPPGMVLGEKSVEGDVPRVISTTASGRPVRRPMKLNVESSAVVAPVVNGVVVKPVSSGKPVGRPRKVGSVGRTGKIGGGVVVKKTARRPRKVVGNNLKERVVMLLEESLGLGMNQTVPDMYVRFVQLYTIITSKEYDLAGGTAQGNNQ